MNVKHISRTIDGKAAERVIVMDGDKVLVDIEKIGDGPASITEPSIDLVVSDEKPRKKVRVGK